MTKMPLTRHFYALDEVQAAVYYCGGRAIWKETVFWSRELVLSGHVSEAVAALFESWLWNRGPFHMRWMIDAMARLGREEIALEDILVMAEALSRCSVKDHSLWAMLVSSALEGEAENLFDRVTPKTPRGWEEREERNKERNKREVFLIRAIYQHKAGAAWWAAEGMESERVWTLLEEYAEHVLGEVWAETGSETGDAWWKALREYDRLLGYRSEGYDRAIMGATLLYLCLTTDQRKQSMTPSCSTGTLYRTVEAEWDQVLDRKAGRVYPIPSPGLYGITVRGRMRYQETTVGELWDVRKGIIGCAYWDEMENLEGCFPDDIPDEWTAEEKGRSHGAGLLGASMLVTGFLSKEGTTLWGWMRRYMTGMTRLLWGKGTHLARKDAVRLYLEHVPLGDSPFSTLLSLPRVPLDNKKPLEPVHKRRVV